VRSERRGGTPAPTLSLDALLGEEEDGTTDRHLDQLPDEGVAIEEQILRLETQLELRQAVAELNPEQQWVVEQRFYQGRSLREVAAEPGPSRQAIHFRERSILRTLRRKLSPAA